MSDTFWSLVEAKNAALLWERYGLRAAVLSSDLAGFTKSSLGPDFLDFLGIIYSQRKRMTPVIEAHSGELVKAEADNLLALFPGPCQALTAAREMQDAARRIEGMRICIGLAYGELLRPDPGDLYGSTVNHACKLGEDAAEPGDILATDGFVRSAEKICRFDRRPTAHELPGIKRVWQLAKGGSHD